MAAFIKHVRRLEQSLWGDALGATALWAGLIMGLWLPTLLGWG